MAGQLVSPSYGRSGQAQGGNAGAVTGAGGQVTGHGEGLGRQGAQVHVAAPVSEDATLGGVDAPGVVGENGLQGVGHALVGGQQGRRRRRLAEDDLRVAGGGGLG